MATSPADHVDALVFWGDSGDLARKKILPALLGLARQGRLDLPVIGVSRAGWKTADLHTRARESVGAAPDLDRLLTRLVHVDGDYRDPDLYARLRQELGSAQRPLHYLAIPPDLFETVVRAVAQAGCARGGRVVAEKPFGHDLDSARRLNRTLLEVFPERAIFRIDHYLGKEPVQNLLYFRLANGFLEHLWNHHHVREVQITMAETFGIAGRGAFYDANGAIRDVVQNHLLQVVALLTMAAPDSHDRESLRDRKAQLLRRVRPVDPAELVLGQFDGYLDEPGVKPGSQVETFAALRLGIEDERWQGVPICIRAGKCLPVTATEVRVALRPPAHRAFPGGPPAEDQLRFRLTPSMEIGLGVNSKRPGEDMVGDPLELLAQRGPTDEMDAYQRLLGDAMEGDPLLFAREDGVEEAWRIVAPALSTGRAPTRYAPGTWGPAEAARLTRWAEVKA